MSFRLIDAGIVSFSSSDRVVRDAVDVIPDWEGFAVWKSRPKVELLVDFDFIITASPVNGTGCLRSGSAIYALGIHACSMLNYIMPVTSEPNAQSYARSSSSSSMNSCSSRAFLSW